jgi:lipoprotein NlpI
MLSKLKGRLKYTKNVVDEEVKGKSYWQLLIVNFYRDATSEGTVMKRLSA